MGASTRQMAIDERLAYNGRMEPGAAAAIILLAGFAAFAQSATGFGFGLLFVPPLAMMIGARDAVLTSNILSTTLVVLLAYRLRADVDVRTWAVLMAGSVAGMPLGLVVLLSIEPEVLQVVIAVNVIVFTALLARGLRIDRAGIAGDAFTGVLSGALRTSTSMSGPPVVIYLQGRGLTPDVFRATISAFFLASGMVAMGAFAMTRSYTVESWVASAVALPAVGVGMVAGNRLAPRIEPARFRRVVQFLLLVSALVAITTVVAG